VNRDGRRCRLRAAACRPCAGIGIGVFTAGLARVDALAARSRGRGCARGSLLPRRSARAPDGAGQAVCRACPRLELGAAVACCRLADVALASGPFQCGLAARIRLEIAACPKHRRQ
jgi:hypothetical protein